MGEDPRYHIALKPGDVGNYVLLPGDRGRVERIAQHLKAPQLMAENREYRTVTGSLDGEKVSVVSSGMGCPCVAIGLEELRTLGVHTVIRVGTTGAIGPGPKLGDAIIAHAALRSDGTSKAYIEPTYPAVADFIVVAALRAAAEAAEYPHHTGLVESSDAYYAGDFAGEKATQERLELLRKAHVLSLEMEASTLFTVGRLRGVRTGCILTLREEWRTDGTRVQAGDEFEAGLDNVIAISVDAIRRLIEIDRKAGGPSAPA